MPNLQTSFDFAKNHNKALHLIGLVSDGGIPPIHNTYSEVCRLAQKAGVKEVYVHAFTDVETPTQKVAKDF